MASAIKNKPDLDNVKKKKNGHRVAQVGGGHVGPGGSFEVNPIGFKPAFTCLSLD